MLQAENSSLAHVQVQWLIVVLNFLQVSLYKNETNNLKKGTNIHNNRKPDWVLLRRIIGHTHNSDENSGKGYEHIHHYFLEKLMHPNLVKVSHVQSFPVSNIHSQVWYRPQLIGCPVFSSPFNQQWRSETIPSFPQ